MTDRRLKMTAALMAALAPTVPRLPTFTASMEFLSMTIALWCVLAAGLLPYLATLIAKSRRGFDNADPRGWLQGQEGFRQRANSAQLNSFEAFPLFAAAVIIASFLHTPQHTLDALAVGFVVARGLYIVCYVANLAALRSVVWFAGLACCVAIYIAAAHTQ